MEKKISIYILGKRYDVPEALTITKAFEYSGFRLIRGSGCRGGFCGACATIYRVKGDPQLKFGLACQTVIVPDMYLTQIPFFPAQKSFYSLEELKPNAQELLKLYPELRKCFGCNTCTKSCPQEMDVMGFISDALRGDFKEAAKKSFDCLMCGLCAARCPQGVSPYHVALLCRRICARYLLPKAGHLEERLKEIKEGVFCEELLKLKRMSQEELKFLYAKRDIEE